MPAGAFGSGGGAEKSACRDVLPDGAPGGVRGDKRAVCPGSGGGYADGDRGAACSGTAGRCGRSVCRGETGGGGGYVGSPGVSLRHPVSVLPEAEAGGGADTGAGGGKRYDV